MCHAKEHAKGGQHYVSAYTTHACDLLHLGCVAIISVLLRLMVVSGHAILPTGGYVILLIGYLALLAGVTFKGV